MVRKLFELVINFMRNYYAALIMLLMNKLVMNAIQQQNKRKALESPENIAVSEVVSGEVLDEVLQQMLYSLLNEVNKEDTASIDSYCALEEGRVGQTQQSSSLERPLVPHYYNNISMPVELRNVIPDATGSARSPVDLVIKPEETAPVKGKERLKAVINKVIEQNRSKQGHDQPKKLKSVRDIVNRLTFVMKEKAMLQANLVNLVSNIRFDTHNERKLGGIGEKTINSKIQMLENIKGSLENTDLFTIERKRVAYYILLRSVCHLHRNTWSWFWCSEPASLIAFDRLYPNIQMMSLTYAQQKLLLENKVEQVLDDMCSSEAYLHSLPIQNRSAIDRVEDGLSYILSRLKRGTDRYFPLMENDTKKLALEALLDEIQKHKKPMADFTVKNYTKKIEQVCAQPRYQFFCWRSDTENTRCTDDWNAVKTHFFTEKEYSRYFDELNVFEPPAPVAGRSGSGFVG